MLCVTGIGSISRAPIRSIRTLDRLLSCATAFLKSESLRRRFLDIVESDQGIDKNLAKAARYSSQKPNPAAARRFAGNLETLDPSLYREECRFWASMNERKTAFMRLR